MGGRSSRGGDVRAVIARATSHLQERDPDQRVQDVQAFNAQRNRLGLTTVYDIGRSSDGDFSPGKTLTDRKGLTMVGGRIVHRDAAVAGDR